ncbi:MAG TPA: hypothetical protein VGE25_05520 [Sediminibacterium sp.]
MKKILFFGLALVLFTSCKSKKMIVMSKGEAEINLEAKTITAKDGGGHEEKAVTLGSGKIAFKMNTPAGEATVELQENGLYVVNVKNDTIIGGYQSYSDPKVSQQVITQEKLKQQIDSLQLLSEAKNVRAANRNFFILPNHAVKITDNTEALVVGPYHRMRSAEKVDGKDPEVYRFYSIKEIREIIGKLQALTVAPKE